MIRIWLWLTFSPSWSYRRYLTVAGIATVLVGAVLFIVGRPGNAGAPFMGVGAVTLAVSFLYRHQ